LGETAGWDTAEASPNLSCGKWKLSGHGGASFLWFFTAFHMSLVTSEKLFQPVLVLKNGKILLETMTFVGMWANPVLRESRSASKDCWSSKIYFEMLSKM
jgi:hypothetical protein